MQATELAELAEQFDLDDSFDPGRIPDEIVEAMEYIRDNTGLLGDYNTGIARLAEGGEVIQVYARRRYLSSHDRLILWVQKPEQEKILFGQIGHRQHPETGEPTTYVEIHPTSKWWDYDD